MIGHLILSQAAHEDLMLRVLLHLEEHGAVLGGSIDGSGSVWRPASVVLYASLFPLDAPWPTSSNNTYVSVMQAIHGLLDDEMIRVSRSSYGHEEFQRIELA